MQVSALTLTFFSLLFISDLPKITRLKTDSQKLKLCYQSFPQLHNYLSPSVLAHFSSVIQSPKDLGLDVQLQKNLLFKKDIFVLHIVKKLFCTKVAVVLLNVFFPSIN